MQGESAVLALIRHIHEAGIGQRDWPDVLRETSSLLDGSVTTLELQSRNQGMLALFDTGEGTEDIIDAYARHYHKVCPRSKGEALRTPDGIVYDRLLLTEAEIDRDEFYADFLAPQDLRYFVAAVLHNSEDELGVVSVNRTPRQGHVSEAEIGLVRLLAPHFRMAFATSRRLNGASAFARSLRGLLDAMIDGVAVLKRDGAIVYANAAARRMFEAGDGLGSGEGGLVFADRSLSAKFGAMMSQALDMLENPVAAGADTLAVPRPSGAMPYILTVRPFVLADPDIWSSEDSVALVFIHDSAASTHTDDAMLRQLYGLTRAELDLARGLRAGLSPRDYAERMALSVNTVRSHLSSLMLKMDVHGRAELIRKLDDLATRFV